MNAATGMAGSLAGHRTDAAGWSGQTLQWKLHWLLRLGVVMEFVGHGACGMNTKAGWLPYFHVFAIPDATAWKLMPLVGGTDILLGLIALLTPRRAVLFYMAAWGCFTALLRPAAGESGWEFVERSYNYGIPLALLLLHGFGKGWRNWLAPLSSAPLLSAEAARRLLILFRVIVAMMLIGHGAFGVFVGKANLLGFYKAVGLGSIGLPLPAIRAGVGFFEIGLGIAAIFATRPGFFVFVCVWKLATESLYLAAFAPLACWEMVERGGSYVAPLAALAALSYLKANSPRRAAQESQQE